jgi:hypothetical protein
MARPHDSPATLGVTRVYHAEGLASSAAWSTTRSPPLAPATTARCTGPAPRSHTGRDRRLLRERREGRPAPGRPRRLKRDLSLAVAAGGLIGLSLGALGGGLGQPVVQAAFGNPEVLRNLMQRSLALAGHCQHVVAELLGVGLRHGRHPSSEDESSQVGCQPNFGQTRADRPVEH